SWHTSFCVCGSGTFIPICNHFRTIRGRICDPCCINARSYRGRSREDDSLVAVDQDAILDVPDHGPSQHGTLDLATDTAEVGGGVAVVDALDILFDDRAGIEHIGDVVGGGADQLDAPGACLRIWVRADEGRQEAVVDVDDAVFPLA